MADILTPAEARRLRLRNDWSLQYLANVSEINKAYLSEFETGQRSLPADSLQKLKDHLTQEPPVGKATPKIVRLPDGRSRLIFIDPKTGSEEYRPSIAHLKWTEGDGTSYTMYLGEP